MYVYMCMYVCLYTPVFIPRYLWMHSCICIREQTIVHRYKCEGLVHVCLMGETTMCNMGCVLFNIPNNIKVRMYLLINMFVCMYVCVCVCVCIHKLF